MPHLKLLADGLNTRTVAACLSVSPRSRRSRRAVLMCVALFGLMGCQTAPTTPMTRDRKTQTISELTRLGFKETENGWEYSFPGKILFETASDALDPASQNAADRIGEALRQLDIEHLRVEGHTDNVGSVAFNQSLSMRRAQAVARALALHGLSLEHMTIRGLGKDKPIFNNDTAENRLQNRRVAVIVPAQ